MNQVFKCDDYLQTGNVLIIKNPILFGMVTSMHEFNFLDNLYDYKLVCPTLHINDEGEDVSIVLFN